MKRVLLLTSFTIFTLYIIGIMLIYGVLPSISDSYYHIPEGYKLVFSFALIGFAFPIVIFDNRVLNFIAGGLICFVAVSPDFKLVYEGDIHYICAVGGVLFGMLSLWINYKGWKCVAGFILLAVVFILTLPNATWWVEVLAFYTILLKLLIVLFSPPTQTEISNIN